MKKKKLIGLLIVGVISVLGGCSYPQSINVVSDDNSRVNDRFTVMFPSTAGPAGNVTFEFHATDLAEHDSVMIYQTNNTSVNTNTVTEKGRKLGFEGDAGFVDQRLKISMLDETEDEVRQFTVWENSGAVEYTILIPNKLYRETPPNLPSEEMAKSIATKFLYQVGLLPSDVGNIEVVTGGSVSLKKKNGTGTTEILDTYTAHLLVRYHRQIDGLPVANSGGNKLGVRIGDRGEVIYVLKVWRDISPYTHVKVKTSNQACQELKAGLGEYYVPPDCKKVIIEEAYLAYWMEPLDELQEYVMPVYEFKGRCLDINGKAIDVFYGWTNAVE